MSAASAGAVPATVNRTDTTAVHASPTIALMGVGCIEMVDTKAS
jgi:hypothetical protein